jgi:hypothetical protein
MRMPQMASFCIMGTRRGFKIQRGKSRMTKSVVVLRIAVTRYQIPVFPQWPGRSKSHILAMGWQIKVKPKAPTREYPIVMKRMVQIVARNAVEYEKRR